MPILLPILLAAGAAPAMAPADTADAQCLAVFAMLASGENADLQKAGSIGALYFTGKIVGRAPDADVEGMLRAVVADAKKNSAAYLQRCGAELQKTGDKMTAAGNALAKDGL